MTLAAIPQTCLSIILSFGELGDHAACARVCRAFRVAAALKTSSPASIRLAFGNRDQLAAHPLLQPRRLQVGSAGTLIPIDNIDTKFRHLTALEGLELGLVLKDTDLSLAIGGSRGTLRSLAISVSWHHDVCIRSLRPFTRLTALSISHMALFEAGHLPATLTSLCVDRLRDRDWGLDRVRADEQREIDRAGWADLMRLPLVRLALRNADLETWHLADLAARMPQLGELECSQYVDETASAAQSLVRLTGLHALSCGVDAWSTPTALSLASSLRRLSVRCRMRKGPRLLDFCWLLGSLGQLTALDVSRCPVTQDFLTQLLGDSKLRGLAELVIGCSGMANTLVHSLAPLSVLTALRSLDCRNCSSLISRQPLMPGGAKSPVRCDLPRLPALHSLCVSGTSLHASDIAATYPGLEHLSIDTLDMDMARLANLREIRIDYSGNGAPLQSWLMAMAASNPLLRLLTFPGYANVGPDVRRALADRGVRMVEHAD